MNSPSHFSSHSPPPRRPRPLATSRPSSRPLSRYVLGLLFLGATVILWVLSAALIQWIFAVQNQNGEDERGDGYKSDEQKPFFLTYFSTSLFTLYLLIVLIRNPLFFSSSPFSSSYSSSSTGRIRSDQDKAYSSLSGSSSSPSSPSSPSTPSSPASPYSECESSTDSRSIVSNVNGAAGNGLHGVDDVFRSHLDVEKDIKTQGKQQQQQQVATSHLQTSSSSSSSSNSSSGEKEDRCENEPFTIRQTASLALFLCPIWFAMEYFYNLSLSLTSLSQNTILSTTSGVFVLLLNLTLFRERLAWWHVVGTLCTISGAYLVYADGAVVDEQAKQWPHALLGDALALLAAAFYGLYTVVVKWKVRDESQVDWQLVLGLLGLYNFLFLWPLFLVLDWTQYETFVLPSSTILASLVLNGLFGTVLADYLWARSILLTSPLIATMGLTLNIPLSLFIEWLWKGRSYGLVYVLGGLAVIGGFVLVNLKHTDSLTENKDKPLEAYDDHLVSPFSAASDASASQDTVSAFIDPSSASEQKNSSL